MSSPMSELLTPTWRFWLWTKDVPLEAHLLYISATPEHFPEVSTLVAHLVKDPTVTHLTAVRQPIHAEALEQVNQRPEWTGKAFTFYFTSLGALQTLAGQADGLLAGRGLHGPPALQARPFGGRSGMLFLRTPTGAQTKLANLLGGSHA